MNPDIKKLMKNFESKTKSKKERYNEFLYYCFMAFDKKVQSNRQVSQRINIVL